MPMTMAHNKIVVSKSTPNCFVVRDANGQALSYVYYESEPGRRSAAKLLSKDEARRIGRISQRRRSYRGARLDAPSAV